MIVSTTAQPPRRYPPDDSPWTTARIEEAAAASGPWTLIEGPFALDPPVVDPASPPTYSFSTDGATLDQGWYRVVFADSSVPPVEAPSEPVHNVPVYPEPSDVLDASAALMAFRLRSSGFSEGRGGRVVAMFTDSTTPTLGHASAIATRNARLVADDFSGALPGDEPELRTIAALRTAIELEASAPQMDRERVLTWREQLREHVERATAATDPLAPGAARVGQAAVINPYEGQLFPMESLGLGLDRGYR